MRNFFKAIASGYKAGLKQYRRRRTDLRRDADLDRKLATAKALPAEAVAELNEIRAILHPPGADAPMTATEVNALRDAAAYTRPAVFPIRGPQDAASWRTLVVRRFLRGELWVK